jgi:hypothetical protein
MDQRFRLKGVPAGKIEVVGAAVPEMERQARASGKVTPVKDPVRSEVVKRALHRRVNHLSMPRAFVVFRGDHLLSVPKTKEGLLGVRRC